MGYRSSETFHSYFSGRRSHSKGRLHHRLMGSATSDLEFNRDYEVKEVDLCVGETRCFVTCLLFT